MNRVRWNLVVLACLGVASSAAAVTWLDHITATTLFCAVLWAYLWMWLPLWFGDTRIFDHPTRHDRDA